MISIKDTREKLNWTQQELALFLNVPRATLGYAESSNDKPNPNIQHAVLNLRLGIHHVDSMGESSSESTTLLVEEKSHAEAELIKQLKKNRVLWQRSVHELLQMKARFDISTRALNYLCWFNANPKGLTKKQQGLIKQSINLEKKNLELFGFYKQSMLQVKIAGLEAEMNSLNALIGEKKQRTS